MVHACTYVGVWVCTRSYRKRARNWTIFEKAHFPPAPQDRLTAVYPPSGISCLPNTSHCPGIPPSVFFKRSTSIESGCATIERTNCECVIADLYPERPLRSLPSSSQCSRTRGRSLINLTRSIPGGKGGMEQRSEKTDLMICKPTKTKTTKPPTQLATVWRPHAS